MCCGDRAQTLAFLRLPELSEMRLSGLCVRQAQGNQTGAGPKAYRAYDGDDACSMPDVRKQL